MDYILSRFNSFSLDKEGLTPQNLTERTKSRFLPIPNSETLLVCLPGWDQSLRTWGNVEKYSKRHRYSFLAYELPHPILSDSATLTKECFESINTRVRKDIRDLKEKYGFKKCTLVAISLSSSYGSMIYKDNPDITEITLICPGENLARDMWHGCRTQHLRKSFESQNISLVKLENLWETLASENNFPSQNTKINIFLGSKDAVIPFRFSSKLKEVLANHGFKIFSKTRSVGHYLLIWKFLLQPQKYIF